VVVNLLEWLPEEEEPSDIVYDGIQGMLEILDPHSNFLDPRSFEKMRERQEGSFFGVGIIISRRQGKVTVIAPMGGTPAAAKGLRAGDIIAAVDGELTEELTLDDVVDRVRGPEGSTVSLTIERPGLKEALEVEITRARIPTNTVRYAFMLDEGIGYVRLSEFANTSVREVQEALDRLADEGMEQLIFDLRDNPGGPLDAAVGVADTFLRKGDLIVSTRGRTSDSVATIVAPGGGATFYGPLVILVNEGSASASEIVAGAVQDHDRGLVLGETTWGKGLVQTVFTVRDTGLALTTARYYTPSGRCIQRDYESYVDYVMHRNGTTSEDAEASVYRTDGGRSVLGGGGITPDVTVESRQVPEGVARLFGQSAFFRFAVQHLKDIPEERHIEVASDFEASGEVMSRFFSFVADADMLDENQVADLQSDPWSLDTVRRSIQVEVLNATLGLEAGYQVAIEGDDQLQASLLHLDEAEDLLAAWQITQSEDSDGSS
jgi:carboxyl-terminal processing protease